MLTEKRKEMHSLKVENYALFGEKTEDFSPEDSQRAQRDCSEEVRRSQVIQEICNPNQVL